MAKGFPKNNSTFDRDRDFDRELGNSSDTVAFARIYDPHSDSEFTNRPEASHQLVIFAQEQEEESRLRRRAESARRNTYFFPSVGKFIIPKDNSWAAHEALIDDPSRGLQFNPGRYVYFDKVIADKLGMRALTDPNHRNYAKYEGLRTNLAVLRNDIIGMYLNDGAFDPGDEKYIPNFLSIAEAIGEGLKNDRWYKHLFAPHISNSVANVEAVGAREIYKYLLRVQTKPGFLHSLSVAIGKPDRNWDLPSIEETPYSHENLAAAPPVYDDPVLHESISRRSFVERERDRQTEPDALGLI